jgi:eukaryotic-like serine/threonine-protein kinase
LPAQAGTASASEFALPNPYLKFLTPRAYAGHVSKARELTKRAVDSAIHVDSRENGAIWQANAALQQAAYGNAAEARQSAAKAFELAPASQGVGAEAALVFAMAGDTARAVSLAQDLGKGFPMGS